jgi:hypothetical protein
MEPLTITHSNLKAQPLLLFSAVLCSDAPQVLVLEGKKDYTRIQNTESIEVKIKTATGHF